MLRALAVRDDDSREEAAGLETGGDQGDQDQEGQHHDQSGFILAKCVGVQTNIIHDCFMCFIS